MADLRYLRIKEVELQQQAAESLAAIRARLDAHDAAHARTHDLLAELLGRLDAATPTTPKAPDAGRRQKSDA